MHAYSSVGEDILEVSATLCCLFYVGNKRERDHERGPNRGRPGLRLACMCIEVRSPYNPVLTFVLFRCLLARRLQ